MYTVKYRPTDMVDFVGNKPAIQPFIRWLLEWDPANKKTKCALISGVSGVGKSLFVELMLKKHDYNIVHLSIDEDRDKETINQFIKPLLKTRRTFNGQENVLVVSEVDCQSGDHGFISTLVDCIKDTQVPIVCICDDRYDQRIKPIINYCFDIKLGKPSFDEAYRLIYKVATTENIKISKTGVDRLYEQSNGDIRYILNTLQMGVKKGDTTKNIQSSNIFDTTGKLLSMDLSIDDLFDSVFDFELSPYVALNTIRATSKCNKKGMIKFPQFLGKISTMNRNKREKLDYNSVKFFSETADKPTKPKAVAKKTKEK